MSTYASIHQWTICLDSHYSQNLIALVSGTLGKELLTGCGCLQPDEPHWLLGWNLQGPKQRSDAQHRSNCVLKALWTSSHPSGLTVVVICHSGAMTPLTILAVCQMLCDLQNLPGVNFFFSWDGWVRMTSNTFFRDLIYLFIAFQSSYQHDITAKAF